jgi:CheY-like chemotaxis protein
MARILIAEDNADLRDLVVRALGEDGHDVTEVTDGAAALEQLKKHDGAFDLLLSDVKMPVMDGIALALATGRDYPNISVVLMTGYADQRERTYGLDALVRDVVAKPFTLEQIKGAVRGALLAAVH